MPVLEPVFNSPTDDFRVSLTEDHLMACFASQDRVGGVGALDVWCAERTSATQPFSMPYNVTAVNTSSNEADVLISPDGLALYFAAIRTGGFGDKDLYVSSRNDRTAAFGPAAHVAALSTTLKDESESMSIDGLTFYFSSVVGVDASQLFVATRPSRTAEFGAPVALDALNTPLNDEAIAITSDHRELLYASTRGGGIGGRDVWYSQRATLEGPFPPATRIAELSSTLDDLPGAITADGTTLYLNYAMDLSGTVQSDVWTSTRTCLVP